MPCGYIEWKGSSLSGTSQGQHQQKDMDNFLCDQGMNITGVKAFCWWGRPLAVPLEADGPYRHCCHHLLAHYNNHEGLRPTKTNQWTCLSCQVRPSVLLHVLTRKTAVVGRAAKVVPFNRKKNKNTALELLSQCFQRGDRRRGSEWDLATFHVAHRFWSAVFGHWGLSVTNLESCCQQLVLSGSFICTVDYPWPESRDTEVILLTQPCHSQLNLLWDWTRSQFHSVDLSQIKIVLCWASPVFLSAEPTEIWKRWCWTPF